MSVLRGALPDAALAVAAAARRVDALLGVEVADGGRGALPKEYCSNMPIPPREAVEAGVVRAAVRVDLAAALAHADADRSAPGPWRRRTQPK